MGLADTECPPPPDSPVKKKGRKKKGKERSLVDRLRLRKEEVCRFVHDFKVPFDNNDAERAIRGTKSKQKSAGGFRSMKGLKAILDLMSYLGTARKHGEDVIHAMNRLFDIVSDNA